MSPIGPRPIGTRPDSTRPGGRQGLFQTPTGFTVGSFSSFGGRCGRRPRREHRGKRERQCQHPPRAPHDLRFLLRRWLCRTLWSSAEGDLDRGLERRVPQRGEPQGHGRVEAAGRFGEVLIGARERQRETHRSGIGGLAGVGRHARRAHRHPNRATRSPVVPGARRLTCERRDGNRGVGHRRERARARDLHVEQHRSVATAGRGCRDRPARRQRRTFGRRRFSCGVGTGAKAIRGTTNPSAASLPSP